MKKYRTAQPYRAPRRGDPVPMRLRNREADLSDLLALQDRRLAILRGQYRELEAKQRDTAERLAGIRRIIASILSDATQAATTDGETAVKS